MERLTQWCVGVCGVQIWSLCTSHYSHEVKRHIFSMLGSLRALGKPVALIRGFGKGASDFIHEPFQVP